MAGGGKNAGEAMSRTEFSLPDRLPGFVQIQRLQLRVRPKVIQCAALVTIRLIILGIQHQEHRLQAVCALT